jgi:tripartite-type tricarboxylate transporter receptor subunit TctC
MPGWGGFIARAGTPPDVVAKLNAEVQRAVRRPDVKERLLTAGLEPPPSYTPAEFGSFIAADIARWKEFVADVGIEKLDANRHP